MKLDIKERTKMLAKLDELSKRSYKTLARVAALPLDLAVVYLEDIVETCEKRVAMLERVAKIRALGEPK